MSIQFEEYEIFVVKFSMRIELLNGNPNKENNIWNNSKLSWFGMWSGKGQKWRRNYA